MFSLAEKKTAVAVKYPKDTIVGLKKYREQVDVVNAVLEDDKAYTLVEADNMVKRFMEGKVK